MVGIPKVSVIMPAYNARRTIIRACASLVAQSFGDWECLVVDDGSADGTAAIVESIGDERFRVIRLERNMGRGVARQVALENSRGSFVAFLDADDWWYPNKLERQLDVLHTLGCEIVSAGMAIVSPEGKLEAVSIRRCDNLPVVLKDWRRLGRAPFAFGPCIMEGSLARACRFDPRLRRAQDYDFLVQACFRKSRLAVVNDILYSYERGRQNRPEIVLRAYKYGRMANWKNFHRDPLGAGFSLVRSYAKTLALWTAAKLGLASRVVERRYFEPDEQQSIEFNAAWSVVSEVMKLLEGSRRSAASAE